MGYSSLLLLWCCWPKLHLFYNKLIWLFVQHHHYYHSQILEIRFQQNNGVVFVWYSLDCHTRSTSSGRSYNDCRREKLTDPVSAASWFWPSVSPASGLPTSTKASTKRFGPNGERFEHLAFLNLAQNVIWSSGSSDGAPWWSYWSCGITNTIGPAMGIEALKYISYPAQACTGKILKNDSRYTFPEYVCTFLVAGGVSTFALLKTSSKTMSNLAHPNAPLGYGLCFPNLTFYGFTNATQDSLKARYPKTNAWNIMLGMNLWGTIYNTIYMFGWPSGSGFEARQHGIFFSSAVVVLLAKTSSFYNKLIWLFGQHHHYYHSIVVSSLLSGNLLSTKQWDCVCMVFTGLSYQIYLKWQKLQRLQKGKAT
ncbi:hypothetical protein Ahy_B02g059055 [Arachis hypogaea]|uniref:Uncharacterized protein n=1 Tax=Arachis hypogaea TaxID=3818 RepID=A0A445AG13_ARAHY|nr:hypothetical protein Ahy_B02g059055 [Arachis hypogaea]